MFVEERQNLIVEELKENGKVRVKDLSEKFSVSEDLIRKDLNVLEKAGKLKKMYGGAVLVRENVQHKIASQRKNLNKASKEKIANNALSFIKDGEIIFLDISTTSIEIAQLLVQRQSKATVVTNMLDVINILASSNINTIFIGGELDYGRDGFVGSLTNSMLESFHFDVCFMGVVGVDLETDCVSTYMANDGQTKKIVLKNSKKKYMLCEHEKLTQIGNYTYARVSDFDGIILDKALSSHLEKIVKKLNISVIY